MTGSKPPPLQQTVEQRRAAHAWNQVTGFARKHSAVDDRKSFVREAKRLPVRAHASGLGQALLFLKVKQKDKPGAAVLAAVCDWLCGDAGPLPAPRPGASAIAQVEEALREGSSTLYRRATDEAQAYLQWLTRFAEAEFGEDQGHST